MEKKVFLWLYGGYGDCVAAYLQGGHGRGSTCWSKLLELKKNFPEVHTKAIVISTNQQSINLVANNPNINDYTYIENGLGFNCLTRKNKNILFESISSHINGYKDIDLVETIQKLKDKENPIYLDKQEAEIYNKVLEQTKNKFVLIHPFASIDRRITIPPVKYKYIIDAIIDSTGIPVVIVGGSYLINRFSTTEYRKEIFEYERKGLINLVNKTSSMLPITKLIPKAIVTIGTWSNVSTTAMIMGKPTIVYLVPETLGNFKEIKTIHFKNHNNIVTFPITKLTNFLINKTVKIIRKILNEK